MARNGSGAYSLPSGNPVITGTVISSTWANTTLSDIGTALTNSIAKDGQTTPTANLPMGGFKLTGLGAGSVAGDSLRYEQVFTTNPVSLLGGLNGARGSVAMHATTMDLWAQPNIIDGTGSAVTITDIADAPQAGAVRILYPVAGTTITDGATFDVDGGANYTTAAGDALIFEAVTTSTFKVHIVKADGKAVRAGSYGLFYKTDASSVAFTKTGADTASIKAGSKIDVAGTLVEFASATAITMPTLTAGTDYAIWVKDDATLQASSGFTSAPAAGNWRKIGGFHYAPGGNAAAVAGGDTTAAINEYSLWDLKFRPACPDPRGMTLVADSFWADIYLLGVDHLTNGTSKYNVTIADGSSPPKIPTKFGGNGSTAYSTLNWWEANEVLLSYGKRSPSYDEFAALAYGTTEATSSGGSDVPTTGVSGTGATNAWNKFTSRWGITQAAGCMWVWGAEFGGGAAGASYAANTGGRGSTFQMENVVIFGGSWSITSNSGSRASTWAYSPTNSASFIGARGVCDHLILD